MTTRVLILEPFDGKNHDVPVIVDPSHLAGYDAGFEAGKLATQKLHTKLTEECSEKFTAMAFGYAEAHSHILTSLKSLTEALMNQVLPTTIDDIARAHLLSVIEAAAINDAQDPVIVLACPTDIDGLSETLPSGLSIPLRFEVDENLTSSQVVIRNREKETSLDIKAFIESLKTALRSCHQTVKEKVQHG